MIIDFPNIEEQSIPNFKGGEKSYEAKMFFDGQNRIMHGSLQPGASIGIHTHDTSSEIIFLVKGHAHVIFEGETFDLYEGQCHYCPKGKTHSLVNDSDSEIRFLAVVPEQ